MTSVVVTPPPVVVVTVGGATPGSVDTGFTGLPGPVGPVGATGAAGLNAYEVAVANGFQGTQAQWLASLQAEDIAVPAAASAVSADIVLAGQPVVIGLGDGLMHLASAAGMATAGVIGLARTAQAVGFVVDAEGQALTLADWTAIAGGPQLVTGATYFLGQMPGTLTTVLPAVTGEVVVRVGVASGPQRLTLVPIIPILL